MSLPNTNEKRLPESPAVTKLKALQGNLGILKSDAYCGPILKKDHELREKYSALEEVVDRRLKEVG